MLNYLSKNRSKIAVFFTTFVLAAVAVGTAIRLYQLRNVGVTPVAPNQPNAQAAPECLIYAVQDNGKSDSQIFSLDPTANFEVRALGPVHTGLDLEGLDMHPGTKELYGTTSGGNDTSSAKKESSLYKVSKTDGSVTKIGDVNVDAAVPALSFRPTDNSLWGWAKDKGLISIDINTGQGTLVYASSKGVEAIAWDNDGQSLYAAGGDNLYKYSYATNTMQKIADNLIGPGDTEGLEMNPDGLLIVGLHGSHTIYTYDPSTLKVVGAKDISTPYDDVEGIAWPAACEPVIIPEHCSATTILVEQPSSTPSPSPTETPSVAPSPTSTPSQACNQPCSRTEDCRALDPNYICTQSQVCRLEENPGSSSCELLPTSSPNGSATPTSKSTFSSTATPAPTSTDTSTSTPKIAQSTPTAKAETLPNAGTSTPTIIAFTVAGLLLLGSLILAL